MPLVVVDKAVKMADKHKDEESEDNCEEGWYEPSSSESDNLENDSRIPLLIESQENGGKYLKLLVSLDAGVSNNK